MSERFNTWLQTKFMGPDRQAPPAHGAMPMQCNGNHAKCLEHLLELLDGQMPEESERIMQANLEACRPCYDAFDVHLAIKAALCHKIKEEPVPERLLEEIRSKITELA